MYCKAHFVVGNCGVEYEGRGYCYECMAVKRAEKGMVWLHKTNKVEQEDEWPTRENKEVDRRREAERDAKKKRWWSRGLWKVQ